MSAKLKIVHATGEGSIYILFKDEKPLKLGEGKFAKVYLGAKRNPESHALGIGDLIAVKFLKRDASTAVTSNALYRFCQEVRKTALAESEGLGTVVGFCGYGRIGKFPAAGSRELELMEEGLGWKLAGSGQPTNAQHPIFSNLSHVDFDSLFAENAGQDIDPKFAEVFTGDFYGLELCLMSLEELLLTRGDPFLQSSGKALSDLEISDAPILRDRAEDASHLKKRKIEFSATANGFEDLRAMAQWLDSKKGTEDPTAGSRFRASVLFGLARNCLKALIPIHEAIEHRPEDRVAARLQTESYGLRINDRGFAHRDLKPANILLAIDQPSTFILSDLGFVASVGDIRIGNYTILSSIDEGGVLPTGSKGFRAPEQIESGEEFSFSTDKTKKAITVFSYFDTRIEPGDFLKISGEFVDRAPDGSEVTTNIARIVSIEEDEKLESTSCILPLEIRNDEELQKGRLIKDVSLHSDIYSIGCISYYLGSEGRNPERFMRFFCDDIARKGLGAVLPNWVLTSPLWMAAVMCLADEDLILSDIDRIQELSDLCAYETYSQEKTQVALALEGRLTIYRPKNHDAKRIAGYRGGLLENKSLGDLFRGKHSEEPISFPQLYLTFLCCLRGGERSIVRRETEDIVTEHGICLAVYSKFSSEFARKIDDAIGAVAQGSALHGDWGAFAGLGDGIDIFIRSRLARGLI